MPPSTDPEWIRRAIERYQAPLLRFASALVGRAQADDVVQDTFLQLVAAKREDVEERLTGWLFTVCRNRALSLKRGPARKTTSLDEGAEMTSEEPSAAEALERRDEQSQLRQLIDALPDRQREVVALRFAGGLSYKEIAGVTGLTETNVGFILHTALKGLKRMMAENDSAAPERRTP